MDPLTYRRGVEDLPLFAAAGEPDPERQIERLVPIARELAERAGAHGVTVSDIRIAAENRGLLTGEERGRRLSWLARVPRAAGLRPVPGAFRRSAVARSHANLHQVYVAP